MGETSLSSTHFQVVSWSAFRLDRACLQRRFYVAMYVVTYPFRLSIFKFL